MLTLEALILRQDDFQLTADWSVPPGERIALIGPSGAGKSTLLMAIAGFFPAAAGRILWQGDDLADTAPGDRPLTMLFQDQNLFPHLTLAQNLGLGLSPTLRLTAAQKTQIAQTLQQVGLAGMEARKPAQLSGGQQGRAALARALLRARPVLLLDEPFAALGPALKSEMLDLLDEVASATGAAVLMVTHDPADAKRFASKTVLVADGVARAPVPTDQLFSNPPQVLSDYLG
ncbi:MAG: thiamine transport system ATP-binding protein [Rhodobacteraceae bacterium]|uniref:thiamine ABC transporter ATP-binding protein n=1 Tax=Cypionkella sp. TaxID=2811411 RepID=UPI00132B7F1E|nr:ATP-binding cassette domain-containing protein [Cypionkella sp.]KAF0174820.1 MAG: thiamine transport system ATP-binding protein [Paracoccaceae bacterium]MDO8328043.1 ATP-binding cassette domain-containing protein [Cypionkella sp.]